MKAALTKNDAGGKVLMVEYQGNDFDMAIDDALSAYGLKHGQVSVIAIPTGSKLLKSMKGGK